MAETLGSLCDKLTIVKLKQWHTTDEKRQESLSVQEVQLCREIDEFVADSMNGKIPIERLTFASNKVIAGNKVKLQTVSGTIGAVFAQLAHANCALWHEQEKVFDFEKVSPEEKNSVVRKLAELNLERTQCIDRIDSEFVKILKDSEG